MNALNNTLKLPPVAILAGGLATRLRPITEKIPKALVEVRGAPFIFHQLQELKKQGISEVVLCVSYKADMLKEAVGDGERFGLKIRYSEDGEELLGTGGAIKKALPLLGDQFFVLYGDSYLTISYRDVFTFFSDCKKQALMTVYRNNNQWDKSNTHFESGTIICYDKKNLNSNMNHIDYGLSLFKAEAFASYPKNFDLADLLKDKSSEGQLAGFEALHRFYEVGSFSGIKDLEQFLAKENAHELHL